MAAVRHIGLVMLMFGHHEGHLVFITVQNLFRIGDRLWYSRICAEKGR